MEQPARLGASILGVRLQRLARPGQFTSEQDPLFTLVSKLHLDALLMLVQRRWAARLYSLQLEAGVLRLFRRTDDELVKAVRQHLLPPPVRLGCDREYECIDRMLYMAMGRPFVFVGTLHPDNIIVPRGMNRRGGLNRYLYPAMKATFHTQKPTLRANITDADILFASSAGDSRFRKQHALPEDATSISAGWNRAFTAQCLAVKTVLRRERPARIDDETHYGFFTNFNKKIVMDALEHSYSAVLKLRDMNRNPVSHSTLAASAKSDVPLAGAWTALESDPLSYAKLAVGVTEQEMEEDSGTESGGLKSERKSDDEASESELEDIPEEEDSNRNASLPRDIRRAVAAASVPKTSRPEPVADLEAHQTMDMISTTAVVTEMLRNEQPWQPRPSAIPRIVWADEED
jgi:hypothetical protein